MTNADSKVDKFGRPEYAEVEDLQPRLDEKNAALRVKLDQMNEQADAELAKFGPASAKKKAPKAAK
jgi:hypothetical protein